MTRPDPSREIRLLSARTVPGANFWAASPVTRLDLAVGAYDDVSTAEAPGLPEALLAALPGLLEHRCSVGERGGFLARLRRGTYAPHVVEHLALELQAMVGHDVGFGRARGGDREGEYTVVFEHRHARVGEEAGVAAVEVARRAFAGAPLGVDAAVARLRAAAATPAPAPPAAWIDCGVTGSGGHAALDEMVRLGADPEGLVAVTPREILERGLPYARSALAVITDVDPGEVPPRYRDPERARRLATVVADAVPRGGTVVAPAGEEELHALLRGEGREVASFRGGAREAAALAHRLLGESAAVAGAGGRRRERRG